MSKHTVITGDYRDADDIIVEIEDTVTPAPVVEITRSTARECKATIDLLRLRKQEAVDKFNAEIALNQARLDAIRAATVSVPLVP